MKAMLVAIFVSLFALATVPAPAFAQDTAACETKAVDKTGKPLTGAAKASYVKKCMRSSTCETKAIDKTGKKLAGAAKTSFIKKCEAAG